MKNIFVWAFLLMPVVSYAHEEVAFGTGTVSDEVKVSEAAQKNIGLKTLQVKPEPFKNVISLPCIIKNPPENTSQIHTTYIGEVKKIFVRVGDKVTKGQPLFTLFSMKAVRDMTVVSPVDGIVSAQNVSIGQIVQMETTLAEISSPKYFIAEGYAYLSDDINHINLGDKVEIEVDGAHSKIMGKVQSFMPIVDAVTKNKSVLVEFVSNDGHIFPNMHCSMDIIYGEDKDAITVPEKAVLGEMGNYFVFLKEGKDDFHKTPVVLGRKSGSRVEILEGVHANEEVVVQGNYQLQYMNALPADNGHEH